MSSRQWYKKNSASHIARTHCLRLDTCVFGTPVWTSNFAMGGRSPRMTSYMYLSRINAARKNVHHTNAQWRSKALRGPGSTVILGPSLSLPSTPPPSPSPPLSLLFPSPAPPAAKRPPKSSYIGGLGSAVSSPAGSGAEPQPKSNLVHFSLKIRHLVATILMIFLKVLPKVFLWPHYSGPPGARGPRFIEPPEPPVPTPLLMQQTDTNKIV